MDSSLGPYQSADFSRLELDQRLIELGKELPLFQEAEVSAFGGGRVFGVLSRQLREISPPLGLRQNLFRAGRSSLPILLSRIFRNGQKDLASMKGLVNLKPF